MGYEELLTFIILGIIFLYLRSKYRESRAHAIFNDADSWFTENEIDPDSIRFNVYCKAGMARTPGACVLVGTGITENGEYKGFVLEVIPGAGVVKEAILEPFGIATHHRRAAEIAEAKNISILEVLEEAALRHRIKQQMQREIL